MEPIPRICIEVVPPGRPENEALRTPATLPARLCMIFSEVALSFRASLSTEETAEERSLLSIVPYPIATASSSPMDAVDMVTLKTVLEPTGISTVS